jgi:hypothetical protein
MASSSRFTGRYSGSRDFAMSTDEIAICGIAIAKPNPDRQKEFLILGREPRVRYGPMADDIPSATK